MSLSKENIARMKAVDFNTVIEQMEDSDCFDRLADICLQAMNTDLDTSSSEYSELHSWLEEVLEKGATTSLVKELEDKDLLNNS